MAHASSPNRILNPGPLNLHTKFQTSGLHGKMLKEGVAWEIVKEKISVNDQISRKHKQAKRNQMVT